jgi:toxin ParE1/3/4
VTSIAWSPQAIRDVESIRAFIAQDSPAYADLVARRIVAAVERLHSFPESGRLVPERQDPSIREVVLSPFRIVYRLRGGIAEIATVFRGSRAFPEFMS